MRVLGILALALSIGIVATACKDGDPTPDPKAADASASQAKDSGIEWFQGGVDAAFEKAAAENKPVFLYWGADWCPPCHQLKATVFSRQDFIEKSRLFVPVYIDGDSPGAQKLGEEFRVSGYPSVVVLRSDRTEIARINGGMDLNQYAEILDLVLGDLQPVTQLLSSSAALSRDDCRRLAYNGWDYSDVDQSELANLSGSLEKAAERCPANAEVERARLIVFATDAQVMSEAAALRAGKQPSPRLADLTAEVYGIVGDLPRAVSSADALRYLTPEFFTAFKKAHATHVDELRDRWIEVMDAVAADPRYSEADQLAAIARKLRAVRALDDKKSIPAGLANAARERVDEALARKHDEHSRAAVVNSVLHVLSALGEEDRAYAVVEQEMKTSKYPYYYMLDLASIEEDRGNKQAAVQWLERAYRESRGAATRFQWGTDYVLGLVRMTPEDDARIRAAAMEVLSELDGPDTIYRRTRVRLERLDSALRDWNKDGRHSATLAAIDKHMDGICAKIPQADPARQICDAFLAPRGAHSSAT
ncbi:MAG TPA: thioredoxin fold domain-containing protein [Steroidobacteraceae bacterium]